jgi:PAS domain S-box-containing protein
MLYFEPWDWIISISTYRKEFKHLVNVADFRKAVLEMHSGPSGYAFVIDRAGTAIIHPKLQGVNILKAENLPNRYLEEMRRRKSGKIIYPWKNPGEGSERLKLVIFNHIPAFDWIVGSSSYLDEFYQPLTTLRNLVIATVLATLVLVLPITFKISASITNPLRRLMHQLKRVGNGNFSNLTEMRARDEVGQLADYFNHFIDQLETHHNDLAKEIDVRKRAEEDLRESEARYRSVMEAAPDPIVVYDMQGRVTYLNPAFTRFFGWTLEECFGKKMDHFVPPENWHETNQMIEAALAGKTFTAVPTCRYDKAGNTLHVSNSGSIYRDHKGKLAGSVIILRDITKSTRLRRQLMNIGDRERQKIGQDLHDDLGPHLIGIHGLSSVLKANLNESSSPDGSLADQIVDLVGEAVEKTRSLTRGLCPVHMVSHGLETALKDLADHTATVSAITCGFTCDGTVDCADNTKATHLYYIAREAVNNAVRHSAASQVTIALSGRNDLIELLISDDGKGISNGVQSAGIGLQIMTYRAKMIGANLTIESTPGSGTRILVRIKKERSPDADSKVPP